MFVVMQRPETKRSRPGKQGKRTKQVTRGESRKSRSLRSGSDHGPEVECCVPDCNRREYSRGECRPCFKRAAAMVRAGLTDWDELISFGLAKPSRAKKANPLVAAFKAAKEAKGAKESKRRSRGKAKAKRSRRSKRTRG